jgi:sulfite reductase (ferredoxin)
VAGGLGTKPEVGHLLHDFIPVDDVYVVTTAVKHLFDKQGNRKNRHAARLRFLWNTLGKARFKELYEEELQLVRSERPAALHIEDVPQSSILPPFLTDRDTSPEYHQWKDRYVENQRQADLVSVRIPIFLGNLKNEYAILLAQFLAAFWRFCAARLVWAESEAAQYSKDLSPERLPLGARTNRACLWSTPDRKLHSLHRGRHL